MKKTYGGFSAIVGLLVCIILVLVGLVGWLVYSKNSDSKTAKSVATAPSSASPTPAPSVTPTTSPTPSPTPIDAYAGWNEYCSSQEKACFRYPSDWSKSDSPTGDPAGDGVRLQSPTGSSLQFWSMISGIGGSCGDNPENAVITKVSAQPLVSGLSVIQATQSLKLIVGLMDDSGSVKPVVGDTGECLFYPRFKSHHSSTDSSWFRGTVLGSDLDTTLLILNSYHY